MLFQIVLTCVAPVAVISAADGLVIRSHWETALNVDGQNHGISHGNESTDGQQHTPRLTLSSHSQSTFLSA